MFLLHTILTKMKDRTLTNTMGINYCIKCDKNARIHSNIIIRDKIKYNE